MNAKRKRKRGGQPVPKADRRTTIICFRISPNEKKMLIAFAEAEGIKTKGNHNDWIRQILHLDKLETHKK